MLFFTILFLQREQCCGVFYTHFFFFFPTLLSNFDFSVTPVHVILSQHSPMCKLWMMRHLPSKQTGSLTSHYDTVFSGYKAPHSLVDRSTHPALRDSSLKSCLLFQEPFKMVPQNIYFFKTLIPSDHEVIVHSKCTYKSTIWRKRKG